ncbi:hypothetical protein AVEN_221688-1, partial [Araneus ventricosus]
VFLHESTITPAVKQPSDSKCCRTCLTLANRISGNGPGICTRSVASQSPPLGAADTNYRDVPPNGDRSPVLSEAVALFFIHVNQLGSLLSDFPPSLKIASPGTSRNSGRSIRNGRFILHFHF